jgi:hypothetical protein
MSGRSEATPRSWADWMLTVSGSVYGTILASSLLVTLSYKDRGSVLLITLKIWVHG